MYYPVSERETEPGCRVEQVEQNDVGEQKLNYVFQVQNCYQIGIFIINNLHYMCLDYFVLKRKISLCPSQVFFLSRTGFTPPESTVIEFGINYWRYVRDKKYSSTLEAKHNSIFKILMFQNKPIGCDGQAWSAESIAK